MTTNATALVVGGTGAVGAHVVRALAVRPGITVRVLTHDPSSQKPPGLPTPGSRRTRVSLDYKNKECSSCAGGTGRAPGLTSGNGVHGTVCKGLAREWSGS
ncbi:NmrA family NAD(P)-binding protein [Streptomyces sp. NPDC003077]|uniref:NAD-dependent epimerase/dehydratase family protein n=1 Tax=Streptomyces sp. NPDC003077 TaxID=3154443 RepID=UPI0033A16C11